MKTQCTGERLEFHALGRRLVTGRFDGGRLSSDAGGVLLREVDKRIGLTAQVSKCWVDYRNPASVEHHVHELISQRLYAIALGYEDLNDHAERRGDAVLSLLVGKRDVTGARRIRARDRGDALASASTLNRMELGEPEKAAHDRYKRIVARPHAFDELLVELFVESHARAPREIWLDLDATDDPLHGQQEGRFFHGYYRCYCYLPLYIFCGEHLLCARLRTSNQDASAGSIEALERIIGQMRRHWPRTRINIRGDSGFCRDALMTWCEDHAVGFGLGLARNRRLVRALGAAMHEAHTVHRRTGEAARRFRDFTHRTRRSWSRRRRVVGKAESLSKGENPRFVVTTLSPHKAAARRLYEKLYCARGDMENRIEGAATRPVCRPHQRAHDAGESGAVVLRLVRLHADARPSTTRKIRDPKWGIGDRCGIASAQTHPASCFSHPSRNPPKELTALIRRRIPGMNKGIREPIGAGGVVAAARSVDLAG